MIFMNDNLLAICSRMEYNIPQQATLTVLEVKSSEICTGTVKTLIPNNIVTGVMNGTTQLVANNFKMMPIAMVCSQELKYNITST